MAEASKVQPRAYTLTHMRRLGFRTRREIAAAVRWTVTTPKGWAFIFSTLVAGGVGSWAADRWSVPVGFFLFPAFFVARVIVPGPPDLGEVAALRDVTGVHESDDE